MTSPAGTREFLPGRASWLALGAFTLFTLIGFAIRLPGNAPIALIGAVVAIGAAAFLLRCRQRVVLAYAALATVGVAMLGNGAASNVGWFAVAVLGMWCVLAGTRRDGLLFWGGALVLFGIEWVFVELDAGWGAWMAGVSFAALGALLRRHEVGLAIELRAAQAGLAERTRAEERGRIAHELHDIVAHSLTVSLLHVAGARLAIEHDPADAARSLAEAERLTRASLDEIRGAVGMLRADGDRTGATAPLPGLAQLPALIDRFRSAGAEITFSADGEADGLPATTGLAVYRIAAEALTNAAKHSPGAPISVELRIAETAVELAVDNRSGPGAGSGLDAGSRLGASSGLGVLSMRERAESLGGTCRAGPGGHGWLVQAAIPLPAGRLREPAT